ncbi:MULTISPECIES: DUF2141 domain-containing protein [Tenacibaculum]|uniref:DUF2141 domain-containing protein n=1 Tax=Tenacibaculum mesophilum TaxID=104268 RepID=A0AAE9SEZ7_9FLAO|nr:DUF2141 domain-containing protein [Tenacibaculum mesophilum]AZJ32287.1 DUF2141 domain-containing protein [Tenacibaculum mesophilum]KAF9658380.1 DUF2141 domain-containing protein [Tenacibaculum mesophilum]QFS27543.1 DUF2141 domain-containing protein [Tenacibaculum mesophilum]UTD14967.1 DUF2141 domain-containing protein [Tenacibaculum mesophilum]SHG11077.1 Uncharacterized conserved protein, DUF2141 family [Tenacibaculum mesophilum]
MKKTILTMIILFGCLTAMVAQNTHTVSIDFKGIKSDKGALFVALYNTEKSFLKEGYKGEIVKITNKKARVEFHDIPKGTYAVSCFHDTNNNKKMDTNFIGIPKEPIGVSNDAKGFMGPPKYKDAKFLVNKDISLVININ